MGTRTPERDPRHGLTLNANDAFKARWSARRNWATMAAVAVHGLLFLWSPVWEPAFPRFGSGSSGSGMELLFLDAGGEPTEGMLAAAVVVTEDSDSPMGDPEPEPEPDEADGTPESDAGEVSEVEGLREELRRRTAPRPTIVEFEPAPEVEEPTAVAEAEAPASEGEGEGTQIGAGYSLSDFEELTDDEALALQRLSALRPELAFISPSSWILLRNPSEVGTFLEQRFGRSSGGGPPASLSVAIWVDDRGSVEWAEIKESSGRREVDESALELFRDVVSFRPARQGGVRVPMAVVFWITYRW